jgi:RecB family exonuclease
MTATDLFLDAFESEVLQIVEEHPDPSRWSAAGRSKTNVYGENGAWWRGNGPKMVQSWLEWRKKQGWKVLDMGGGEPAIELPVYVPTSDGVPFKAFIDRVMVVPEINELVIVDLKSGKRTPESDNQLGFYRFGLAQQYGIDVRFGTYWMARVGRPTEMFGLRRYKPALVEKWISEFDRAREAGIFLPNITFRCKGCPMSRYCAAYGGVEQDKDPDFEGEV